ncbi:GumC family protein [Edaphobacter modestus]|uniref:non-specific protein-tyrosine kinase n=1 Tax=Edaphobacter modestus TaxID=388466 RepID=A0A4V2G466_9BACT|nr:polysaccharide biosynthesis tyrosine autokinase [Edaphobacter modestus]RZU39666.1 capsular exopolysaccharide synthesis family protein [Edaphobacter modestus]
MGPQSAQTPSHTGGASETTPPAFSTATTDTTLSETLITLRKRKRILLVFVLLGLIYGIYRAETQPRIYEAFGRIQVRSGSSNEFRVSAVPGMASDSGQRMLTEVAILQSDSLMLSVAREMDLANNPDFLGGNAPSTRASIDDPDVRQRTIHQLLGGLRIAQVQKTELIRISFQSLSPKLASDIVNKIISAYIQRSYETRFSSSQKVSTWLSGQLDDLKQQVQASQEQMLDVQRRLGILGFDPNHSQITASLEQLSTASNDAHIVRIMAESRYRMLSGMDPNTIEGSLEASGAAPSQLNALRAQLATARATLAQMESDLGPNHPQAKAQKAQIAALSTEINTEQQRLVLQAKENFLAARTNQEETAAALEKEKSDAYKLRDDLVEYTIRQREFESSRHLYESLLERLRTAGIEAGLESLEIDVVDPALLPATPTLKPKSTVVLTYLFMGLVAGVMLSFLLESLDTGLRSVAEVESIIELPSLAIIPRFRRSTAEVPGQSTTARNIISLAQPKSQFAEAFRSLRTALLLSSAGHPPKYILLTSATPSEGKTTASTNLATILAQGDARVLLIDADLRRPTVHQRFGLTSKIGLSTLLAGATTLEAAIQKIPEVPNLDVLVSGPMPPFPTEMLSSEAMRQLLDHAGEIYTHIVIDSPPVLSVTDAVLLARQADAVVLVIRHGKSNKHVVRRARDLLLRSGAPVTGILLNAVDVSSPDYYGYYGYSGYSSAGADAETWQSRTDSRSTGDSGEVKR